VAPAIVDPSERFDVLVETRGPRSSGMPAKRYWSLRRSRPGRSQASPRRSRASIGGPRPSDASRRSQAC